MTKRIDVIIKKAKKVNGGFKLNKIITAIICITFLEMIALLKGINGTILTLIIATIAGLAGLATKTPKILEKE